MVALGGKVTVDRVHIDWRSPERRIYSLIARGASGLAWLLADVEVVGGANLPREGPTVLAANHPSYVESLVTAGVVYRLGRKPRFLALSSLFDHPVAGPVFRRTRMIPVYRGHGPQVMVSEAARALDAGETVVVYPEGRLAPAGVAPPARPGAGLLALDAPGPVVPMASAGIGSSWWRVRRPVVVRIGEPIDLSGFGQQRDRETQLRASAAVLGRIRQLHGEAERRLRDRRRP